jgi:outer membrane protein assembly factor BamB
MYAIHPNGTLKWSWTSSMNNCWIETSPAIGQNGELYFLNNCFGVTALDSEGHLLWNEDGSLGEVWNSPSLGPDGTIYIGSSDHFFYALYPNGTIKWKVPVDAVNFMYESCSAISSDGSAIFHGDNGGLFYAFDKSGYVKWTYDTGINGVIQCAPALSANGIVYFTQGWTTSVQTGDKGYLYALRASDGSLLWKYEIGWSISSPAIAADGTLYAVGEDALGNAIVYSFGDE